MRAYNTIFTEYLHDKKNKVERFIIIKLCKYYAPQIIDNIYSCTSINLDPSLKYYRKVRHPFLTI